MMDKLTDKQIMEKYVMTAEQLKRLFKIADMTEAEYVESLKGTEYKDSMDRQVTFSGLEHEVRNAEYYHRYMTRKAEAIRGSIMMDSMFRMLKAVEGRPADQVTGEEVTGG